MGLDPKIPYIKAHEIVRALNKDNFKEAEKIRVAAKRTEELVSLHAGLFPDEYIQAFKEKLKEENFGSNRHLLKLYSHFNFIQQMCIQLKIEPKDYKEASKKIYKYFVERKISVNYSARIISLLNRWGLFVSRKQRSFYDEVPVPRGREQSAIADAQKTKRGTETDLGVRQESLPLTPAKLEKAKKFLIPEQYNWLKLSVWFGLRPEEVDMLVDEKKFRLEFNLKNKIHVLHVYQSKLQSVAEDKRWKKIPIVFKEQQECLDVISAGSFKRPLHKTVRKYVGKGVTLYGGRKNFVDMMMEKGQKLEDISLWLGHASIETTWSHYKDKDQVNFVETSETKRLKVPSTR
ncbi:hypothetical protein ACNQKP_10710 [Bdellovibrio bacteriovorus]|uniref:hypothetical protein n=1 Tax=Bdellovibrio bacteriovorus TaxID=959 RepID=UPI003AA9B58F